MRRVWRSLLLGLLAALPAVAQLPDDLEVGAYVEVKGTRSSDGGVVADEVEVQATAAGSNRLRGAVESVAAGQRRLIVAGVPLRLDANARLTDAAGQWLEVSALRPGGRVDARGVYAHGEFLAHSLALAGGSGPPDARVRLEGTIDAVDPDADAFRLLGLGVRVTPETWVELD